MKGRFFTILCVAALLTSCGEYNKVAKYGDPEYKYEVAKSCYARGKYTQAYDLLNSVVINFKGSAYGEECLYLMSMSAYMGRDYDLASSAFKKYYQSGEINSKVTDVKPILDKIRSKYADGRMFELDGISVEYSDWWFNIRSSNTEPLLRLIVEAKDKATMEAKRDALLSAIRKSRLSSVVRIYEEDAGLHFILEASIKCSDSDFCKQLRQKGVNIKALSEYFFEAKPSIHKFVINYSSVDKNRMQKAVQALASLCE